MGWGDNLSYDFEFALASGKYNTPTIVMLDFGSENYHYESVIDRIDNLKDSMAIVLRPPADTELFARLRARGLSIFDGVPAPPAVVAEAIH